jgi:hypothetical protein
MSRIAWENSSEFLLQRVRILLPRGGSGHHARIHKNEAKA